MRRGIDGKTWQQYAAHLEANLVDLAGRMHRGAYHATLVKRMSIPNDCIILLRASTDSR